jgi:hypothetical protein
MRVPVSNTSGESLASRLFRMSALLIQAGKKDASPVAIRRIIMVLEAAALVSFLEFGIFMVLVRGGHPASWQVSYAYYWMMMPVGICMILATAIIQYVDKNDDRLPDLDSSARWGISSAWWGILKTAAKTVGVGLPAGLYMASLIKRVGLELSSFIGLHGLVQNVALQTVALPLSVVYGTLTNTWWVATSARSKDVEVQDTLARFLGRSFWQWLIRPFISVDDPSLLGVNTDDGPVLARVISVLARTNLVLAGGPLLLSVMIPGLSGVIPHPGRLGRLALLGLLALLVEQGQRFARGRRGRIVPTRDRTRIHMPMRVLISPVEAKKWAEGLTDRQVKILVWSLLLLGLVLFLLPLALVAMLSSKLGTWFVVPAAIVGAEGAKLMIELLSSWVQFFGRNGRPPRTEEEWAAVYRFALQLQVLTVLDNLLNVGLANVIALGMSRLLGNQEAIVYQVFLGVITNFTGQPISALMSRYAKTVDAESRNARPTDA